MPFEFSEQPILFVVFALTDNNEVICINDCGTILLPRYEFQLRDGKECITDALYRQMQNDIGYQTTLGTITIADTEQHHAKKPVAIARITPHTAEEDIDDEEEFFRWIDPKKIPKDIVEEKNCFFRVCVACGCIPCEPEENNVTEAPFVQWARWAQSIYHNDSFEVWEGRRQARVATKNKVILLPLDRWDDMILNNEITDEISISATPIAHAWITKPKP